MMMTSHANMIYLPQMAVMQPGWMLIETPFRTGSLDRVA